MIRRIIIFLCCSTTCLVSILFAENNDKSALYKMAGEFYKSALYDKAIEYCQKAIALDPNYDEPYYGIGLAYAGKGDEEKAVENFQKVIELNPSNASAYTALGAIFLNKRDIEKAIGYLKKAIEVNPSCPPESYFNLGSAYYTKGDFEQAVKYFKKLVDLSPYDDQAHTFLGNCYLRMGKNEEARAAYTKAMQLAKERFPTRTKEIEDLFNEKFFKAIPSSRK